MKPQIADGEKVSKSKERSGCSGGGGVIVCGHLRIQTLTRKGIKRLQELYQTMTRTVKVTRREQQFIKRLKKVLANPPKGLWLFGWAGTLCLLKADETGHPCVIEDYFGISGDGGDPDEEDVAQNVEIEYL